MRQENEDYWKRFLEDTVQYFLNLKDLSGKRLINTPKKVPFIGFGISSISLLSIYQEEVVNLGNVKYLLTYKFSQDPLELLFCNKGLH